MSNRKAVRSGIVFIILITLFLAGVRWTKAPTLHYDKAYWPETTVADDSWLWVKTQAGITYSLYLPKDLRGDTAAEKTIPLIVCFHGSTEKHISKDRYGRIFTTDSVQNAFGDRGVAVLVPQSRVEYFSDTRAYARLIENVCIQHRAIDTERIAAYGFSQGAAFVHEMTGAEPFLFRAAMTGSSYYAQNPRELLNSLRVRYYGALSRNDMGIYEQGLKTAQRLGRFAPDSRYVEYEKRGHFYIEMKDTTGRGAETALDWLVGALTNE